MNEQADKLHAAIMNLRGNASFGGAPHSPEHRAYRIGHRDARHAAAELVSASLSASPASNAWGASVETVMALHKAVRVAVTAQCIDPSEANIAKLADAENALRAEVSRLAASTPSEQGWQTIDSAPKDGLPLRLFCEAFIDPDFNPGGSVEGQWCDDLGWVGAVWNPEQDVWDTNQIVPTHWQPIPSAPVAHQENT